MTPFILCVAVYITMPVGACRKRPAAARPLPPDDGGTFRALAQCGNKTNLGAALTALQSAGWLTAAVRDHVGEALQPHVVRRPVAVGHLGQQLLPP